MKTTPEKLAELKALAEAATPGPWWSGMCNPADGYALAWIGNAFIECDGGCKNYAAPSRDAEFIAAAREAIPALIADLEEAEEKSKYGERIKFDLDHTAELLHIAEAELAATRKQLEGVQALKLDDEVLVCIQNLDDLLDMWKYGECHYAPVNGYDDPGRRKATIKDIKKACAYWSPRLSKTHVALSNYMRIRDIQGTSALDALLTAKERETLQRCAKVCELALSSAGTTPAECLYAIRAMLKNETSCTQS